MPQHAAAFWVAEPGRGEIRTEPLPAPGPGDVVVRSVYSGISRGTEALVFHGRVPASEHARMRAPFQAGDFPAPVKYGYASVGLVEEGPPELRDRHVFVLYPHQDRYVVPALSVHPLPDGTPPERAILAANLETAINGLWDASPHLGDRISVIGAGTVGSLTAWLASRIPGCDVELIDVNPDRREIAGALGVRFADPTSARPEADLVIHASGSPAGAATALRLAGTEATVVEMSWYGDAAVPLPLGAAFHARRLTLRSSQVGMVPPAQRPRWDTQRRLSLALRLLSDPATGAVITGESAFSDLPGVMARLASNPAGTLCHRIIY